VEVTDDGPEVTGDGPETTGDGPAASRPAHANGWGLQIVAGVTDRCGAAIGPGGQRTAWAEVTWRR
jgi:hypothetical protein